MNEAPSPTTPAAARGRFHGRVVFNETLCREHYRLRLRIPPAFPPTLPGQFVQLGCRPPEEAADIPTLLGQQASWQPPNRPELAQPELCEHLPLLRRPFSLAGRGRDEHGQWIDIIHRVVGAGTAWLAERQPGDALDMIGPLGNSFHLPDERSLALLVGGGVGLPPMFYLAERLKEQGWDAVAFVGAQSRDLLSLHTGRDEANPEGLPTMCVDEFAQFDYPTVITTDDGTLGLPGRITDGLERLFDGLPDESRARAVLFTCGPEPMMRAAWELARAQKIPTQACLEQAMACGMGTCQSCIVRIEEHAHPHDRTAEGRPWRYRLACHEGPVFDAADVVW